MDLQLKNKRAIVTGGASGIGLATARLLLSEGASVAILDISASRIAAAVSTLERVENGNGMVLAEVVDAPEPNDISQSFARLSHQMEGLDILVHCAGRYMAKPVLELNAEEWDELLAINLRSTLLCCQSAARHMMDCGGGSIVNLGSVGGQVGGVVSGAHYSASKAGVICLTKSLARQLASHRIRVNVINPGVVDTPMTQSWPETDRQKMVETIPAGRFATPEEVAAVVVFVASPAASYMNGTHIDVNGGMHMA